MGNSPTKLSIGRRSKPVKRSLKLTDDAQCDQKKPKIEAEPLRLVDINEDCLRHIFEHLDLQDLVNVAESHVQFVPAATGAFLRYHRMQKRVFINLSNISCENDDCLEIRDDNIAAFFHHFGAIVSNLMINFLGSKKVEVGNLLQKYCSDSIVNLDLAFCSRDDFQSIDKPFTKVEKLTIIESTLSENLSQLNTWFPSLTKLELIYANFAQPKQIEVNFAHLEHLEIYNLEMDLPEPTLREVFRLNPQLKTLVLLCDYGIDFLRLLSRKLPQLEELELWAPKNRFSNFNDEKIHFKSVKKFTLNADSHRGSFVVNMPLGFNGLQELTFDGFNQFKGQLLDFVMECKDLRKLKLMPFIDDWDDLTCEDLEKVVDSMANLSELEFCADTFVVEDVIQFLSKTRKLKKVNLLFIELPLCPHFLVEIEAKWQISKHCVEMFCSNGNTDYFCFNLERKD